MPDGNAHVYAVHLLYEHAPKLDKAALLASLRKHCGRVDPLGPMESDLLAFLHLDHVVQYKDAAIPAQCLITTPEMFPTAESLEPALQQSRFWRDARSAVSRCHAAILITDVMATGLDYKERLQLFHGVVLSVLERVPCAAIHWTPMQMVVDPAMYLDARRHQPHHPLDSAVNVRLFRIEQRQPGEMLMDSLGLGVLGLPDVQCHFVGLDPNDVAQVLYAAAYYLFDNGDILNDGETFGMNPNQRWKCQHEVALVGPEREVIDINPGKPHAAGTRG